MIKALGMTFAALAVTVGPLAAQQHQHEDAKQTDSAAPAGMGSCAMMGPMMQMMQMMEGHEDNGMMHAMRFAPAHILTHRESLGLTADQVARVEAVQQASTMPHQKTGMSPEMKEGMQKQGMQGMASRRQALAAAFEASPANPEAIRSTVGQMSEAHGAMMADHLVAFAKVRDILTPAQRSTVASLPSPCMPSDGSMMQHDSTAGKEAASTKHH